MKVRTGRPPKPDYLKRAEGTYRKDRDHTPVNPAPGIPSCPAFLSTEAKKEWRRIVKLLDGVGYVSHLDRALLTLRCQAWADWVEADEQEKLQPQKVFKSPNGYGFVGPLTLMKRALEKQLLQMDRELFLTPSARQSAPPVAAKEEDPLAKFFPRAA